MPKRNLPPFSENLRWWVAKRFLRSRSAQEKFLRKRLRRTPRWTDGHLALAETLFFAARGSSEPPHQRTLSGIRISAEAVRAIERSGVPSPPAPGTLLSRQQGEAELWLACFDFLGKRYEASVSRLERVLEAGNVKQLSRSRHLLALEYAASAAAVLGRDEDARRFLAEIPEKDRPRDVRMLGSVLENRK